MTPRATPLPLQDVFVLDLTLFLAGPYCTMLLADYGAEVIKVEAPGKGDNTREIGPFSPSDQNREAGGYFLSISRNKKAITLDLKKEKGKKIFLELVRRADILVENFRPGVMERLGLGWPTLRELNPKLVYASISGFGQTDILESPYWDRPAFDLVAQAMSGAMSITGHKGGSPLKFGPGIGDIWASVLAAYGIMVALHHAQRTGQGQHVDCAMYDAMVYMMERAIMIYSLTGEISRPMGNSHPLFGPYDVFRTMDAHVVIAAHWENHWRILCDLLGREDLRRDRRLQTMRGRAENHETLVRPTIEEWTVQRTTEEIVNLLIEKGVPVAPVHTVEDLFKCRHIQAREMLVDLVHPIAGKVKAVGVPIKMSRTPGRVRFPAPLLGEHTREVLSRFLNYDDQTIDGLKKERVI